MNHLLRIVLALAIAAFGNLPSFGQTGPGGVGSSASNGLWLRAGDVNQANATAVATWSDISGNSNDAAQATGTLQPLYYTTSSMNNQPVVRFDGSNDEMAVPDANILDNSAGITFYAAIRPNNLNGSARGILGKRITFSVSVEYAYTWFFWSGNRLNNDIHTLNDRYNTGANTFANATNYVLSFDFDGSLASSERSRMYSQGVKVAQASETSTALPNSNQALALGALNVGYGTYLGADYGEIIHYNYSLDSAEHIIVQNYLAAKYGVTLGVNDLYDEDNAGNGNYDFDVAGIGRVDGNNMHDDSQGSGIVRILNPSNLGDDEFMFWGHDGGVQQAVEFSDIPVGMQGRFDRVWRVSEVDGSNSAVDVGSVDIRWDLTGLGAVTTTDLRLLIDTDNDGNFNDETPIAGATSLGGNIYAFTGVTGLTNNARFTLGTINLSQTPLPIELLEFTATPVDDKEIELHWKTGSEFNNDYFTVERSSDGKQWTEVLTKDAAGTSQVVLSYDDVDTDPLKGISYYRLKQTDHNGDFSYSDIVPVNIGKGPLHVSLYPNPTTGDLYVRISDEEMVDLRVFNMLGQDVTASVPQIESMISKAKYNMSTLESGVYTVVVNGQARMISKQ